MGIQPSIYPIQHIGTGLLAVMPKPVSGEWMEDEFAGIARWGITHIVSLLEETEAADVGLAQEGELAEKNGMQFTSFPIPDRCLPADSIGFVRLTHALYTGIRAGNQTVVHCRAGIGRAGMLAAGILIQHGLAAEQAFELISQKRRVPVPDTPEQFNWICQLQTQIRNTNTEP
jgi:protein-tyrosine phosphatase